MTTTDPGHLARNLRLITVHEVLAGSLVWLPVFVLFTRSRFDLDGALALASIYYLAVVVLEVPSGWMSDRLGRVPTLRLAAVCWVAAQTCFLIGDDRFAVVALGQILLAGGFASLSGTDVTFHYDTLESMDRATEFRDRQARLRSLGLTATAASALVGGLLALVGYRSVFAVALALAAVQVVVAMRMTEPPRPTRTAPPPMLLSQLRLSVGHLADRYLGWIFFYGFVMVTLEHVAFEMMQPWLTELLGRSADDVGTTPVFAGMVFAVTSFVGAAAARASAPVSRRFGVVPTLLALAALSAIIVTGMALWVHAMVVALLVLRSVQGAAAPVLISDAVAPRVDQSRRATLLSLNSLVGRLGYGLLLWVVSDRAGDDVVRVLGWLSMLSWLLVAVLVASAFVVTPLPRGAFAGENSRN